MTPNPTSEQVFDAIYDTLFAESYDTLGSAGLLADVKVWYKNRMHSVEQIQPFFTMELTSKDVKTMTCGPGGQDWHNYTFTLVFGSWDEDAYAARESCYKLSQAAQDLLRPNDCGVFFMPVALETVDIAPYPADGASKMVWFAGFTVKGIVKYYRPR